VVDALDTQRIDYALAGALALAVHGVARATTDIDLLVRPEDAGAAAAAVARIGFTVEALPLRFSDGMEVRRVTKLQGGESLTLDLLLVDENLEEAWRSRTSHDTGDGPLWVISRDALIGMKARAGRTSDLADIERLRELDR